MSGGQYERSGAVRKVDAAKMRRAGQVCPGGLRRSLAAGLCLFLMVMLNATPSAQQRPLETQAPEPIGTGRVLIETGVTYARDMFYPLSGLEGNLWQLPVIGLDVGLSPIADLQITGGPYDRLSITDRRAAPLESLVPATGGTTHDVDDLTIGTKIRLVPETAGRPGIGFRFSVRLAEREARRVDSARCSPTSRRRCWRGETMAAPSGCGQPRLHRHGRAAQRSQAE